MKSITKMKICYNNAFSRMFHLDRFCSASGMFANFYTASFGEIVKINKYRFICRLWSSHNLVLNTLVMLCLCRQCGDNGIVNCTDVITLWTFGLK